MRSKDVQKQLARTSLDSVWRVLPPGKKTTAVKTAIKRLVNRSGKIKNALASRVAESVMDPVLSFHLIFSDLKQFKAWV